MYLNRWNKKRERKRKKRGERKNYGCIRFARYGALLRVSLLLKTLLGDNRTYPGCIGLVPLVKSSIIGVDNEPPSAPDRAESLLEIYRAFFHRCISSRVWLVFHGRGSLAFLFLFRFSSKSSPFAGSCTGSKMLFPLFDWIFCFDMQRIRQFREI